MCMNTAIFDQNGNLGKMASFPPQSRSETRSMKRVQSGPSSQQHIRVGAQFYLHSRADVCIVIMRGDGREITQN